MITVTQGGALPQTPIFDEPVSFTSFFFKAVALVGRAVRLVMSHDEHGVVTVAYSGIQWKYSESEYLHLPTL